MPGTLPPDFHAAFFNLQDPRQACRTAFRLLDVVFMAVCATIAGADDWPQMETWAHSRKDWLARFCHLPDGTRTPSHDTFERVFRRLRPAAFARCFREWTAPVADLLGVGHIAIDGKTLRGSGRDGLRALHLVSAWATHSHLSLAQVAVDRKSNEITAIPLLLDLLDLEGALVSLDAMGCQKKIAAQVVGQGGDYVLVVKKNQGRLYDDIERTFGYALALDLAPEIFRSSRHEEAGRGHGRAERRDYLVLSNLGLVRDREQWAGLARIGRCEREREVGGVVSREVSYFIGSREAGAEAYGAGLRGHWGVENNCHWQLDVTFGEDASRVADRAAAENLSTLRRFATGALKRHPRKKSLANKRYEATLDTGFLAQVLGLN